MATATLQLPKPITKQAGVLLTTDTANMAATFTISTPTPDRSDDVVLPGGFDLRAYAKNAPVFYDHGMNPAITLPIGKSKSPDGRLAVTVHKNGVDATCYFSQHSKDAAQIYALVDEGILQAASVSIRPLESSVRSHYDGYRPGLLISKCELLEWSVVSVPDNPEAILTAIHKRYAGAPLNPAIAESLQRYAPPRPVQVPGYSLPPELQRLKAHVLILDVQLKLLQRGVLLEQLRMAMLRESPQAKQLARDLRIKSAVVKSAHSQAQRSFTALAERRTGRDFWPAFDQAKYAMRRLPEHIRKMKSLEQSAEDLAISAEELSTGRRLTELEDTCEIAAGFLKLDLPPEFKQGTPAARFAACQSLIEQLLAVARRSDWELSERALTRSEKAAAELLELVREVAAES